MEEKKERKPIGDLTEHHFKQQHLLIERFDKLERILKEILNKINTMEAHSNSS